MELFVLLWLLMGVVAGVIASNKGRSGVGFGILGACLGPIGILAAALASSDPNHGLADRVACPHCAELILPTARVCRFCGNAVEPASYAVANDRGAGPVEGQTMMNWLLWGKPKR